MNILLTNDDGWDAPGLQVLKAVARQWGDVWVVAPLHPMSGISHQMTFERGLTLQQTDHQAYSLDGTPADCVRIATTQLNVDFDWVLSGINNGGNLGSDIFVSGTVAAAREGSIRGYPAIALSQHRHRFKETFDWTTSGWMCEKVLSKLLRMDSKLTEGTIWNINFPDKFHLPKMVTAQNGSDQVVSQAAVVPSVKGNQQIQQSVHYPIQHEGALAEQNSLNEPESGAVERESFLRSIQIVDCATDRVPVPADFKKDDQGRFWYCGKYNRRQRTEGCDIDNCFDGKITVSQLRW